MTALYMTARHRLRSLRVDRGLSQEALAKLLHSSKQQISRLESGERQLTELWLRKLAAALGCRVSDIVGELGPTVEVVNAPLISWVQAGGLVEISDPYEPGFADEYIPVDYHRKTVIALHVRGDSMDRVAPEGSTIIVDFADRVLVDGKLYVVRINDTATFKRYRAGPDRFEAVSTKDHEAIFPTDPVDVVGRVVRVTKEL